MSQIDHPRHYNAHPSGVEAIDVCERLGFNLGNAVKYLMRADHKGAPEEDRRKAAWYLRREAETRTFRGAYLCAALSKLYAHEPSDTPLGELLRLVIVDGVTMVRLIAIAARLDPR